MKKAMILVTVLFLYSGAWADVANWRTEDFRHAQTLSWEAVPNVSRYAVVVEENTATGWVERVRETTGQPELRVSLKSGEYRFSVTAFDYFDRASEPSPWMPFTVLPALLPTIRSVNPSNVRLDEAKGFAPTVQHGRRTLSIEGENLLDSAEIMIVPTHGEPETDAIPVDFSTDGRGQAVNIFFDFSTLPPDKYDIVIKNPGGLQTAWRNFEILPVPSFASGDLADYDKSFFIHEGYAPLVPLSGVLNEFLDQFFYPAGAAVKLSWLPFNTFGLKWGFEAETSWAYLAGSQSFYTMDGHMINIPACLVIQKRLWNERLWFSVRGGGGFTVIRNFIVRYNSEEGIPINTWAPLVTGGVAVTVHIVRGVFLDIGVDIVNVLSSDDFKTSYLRPMIGLGGNF